MRRWPPVMRGDGQVAERTLRSGPPRATWLKVKPVHTLDLVVLAVEWGSGRRRGKLSNIHLGARDPATGGFVMLGKTFKGMTDAMLEWQTQRFLQLAVGRTDGYVVKLRPQQVVEVAFDGIQASPRYPGGLALRFARVLRYRDDKPRPKPTLSTRCAQFTSGTTDSSPAGQVALTFRGPTGAKIAGSQIL
ncbi:ATP dependent DNA ligase family protein [Mycobacterium xenopi 4042]|uniref:DNA ligase B n=1 Tax=Mycobacterium xenopi 4042 TaxID=1299334 RepID=X7Z357_MYCXE|nr:ATP dependent DNA ligase family protein [Mycobacterium xenopi 4042]